jgi:hypothetical protein
MAGFGRTRPLPPEVLKAGDTFLNCNTFNEDAVADTLESGACVDPLFPAPGKWVQTEKYDTATTLTPQTRQAPAT